jgi:hypothetical protein
MLTLYNEENNLEFYNIHKNSQTSILRSLNFKWIPVSKIPIDNVNKFFKENFNVDIIHENSTKLQKEKDKLKSNIYKFKDKINFIYRNNIVMINNIKLL